MERIRDSQIIYRKGGVNREIQFHQWLKEDSIKVKLERGQKGTYAWEITYEGVDELAVIGKIKEMDTRLRENFGQNDEGGKE